METAAGIFWVLLLGLCTGSLAAAAVVRVPAGLSMFSPPSHCLACGARLGLLDLLPVVSWLASGGRCRHCGDKVSAQYSFIEVLVGAGFVVAWLVTGGALSGPPAAVLHAALLAILFTCLVVGALIDLRHWYVPRGLILVIGLAGVANAYLDRHPLLETVQHGLVAMIGPVVLMALYRLLRHRKGIGWDDVLLFLAGGFWLSGREIVLWWTVGPLCSVIGAVLGGVRRARTRVPMSPGLSVGLVAVLLFRLMVLA